MNGLIPKAVSYAKKANTLENRSYQKWLAETIEREDLIAWARDFKDVLSEPNIPEPKGFKRFLSILTP